MAPKANEAEAMRRALVLARSERPHPNPRVGAVVIAADGTVLAEGAHRGPGHDHAEVAALAALPRALPPDSVMVVTLEPCNHHGRTPPCTEAVISAGIRRVVVGVTDPDPRVSGSGVARLLDAGVDVEAGVLANEVEAADPAYFHHRRSGRPLVTLKTATTIDGQTAAADGTSQWITSPEARADAHLLRAEADAVVVGSGTLLADDPLLTVRLDGDNGGQPVAVVVAGLRPLPHNARLWGRPGTLVVSGREVEVPVQSVMVDADPDGRPVPDAVLSALSQRGLLAILLEGGASLATGWWNAGVIDRGVTYLGGLMAGGAGKGVFAGEWPTLDSAHPVDITHVARVGPDVRVDWRTVAPPTP